MGRLVYYAMKNPIYRNIVSTPVYQCSSSRKTYVFENTNALLHKKENYYDRRYPFCNGGKTGQSSVSGYSLISSACKNNTEIICVQLSSLDQYGTDAGWSYRFSDAVELFEYTFNNYKKICSPIYRLKNKYAMF